EFQTTEDQSKILAKIINFFKNRLGEENEIKYNQNEQNIFTKTSRFITNSLAKLSWFQDELEEIENPQMQEYYLGVKNLKSIIAVDESFDGNIYLIKSLDSHWQYQINKGKKYLYKYRLWQEELIFRSCLEYSPEIILRASFYRGYIEWKNNLQEGEVRDDCIGATVALAVTNSAINDYNKDVNKHQFSEKLYEWLEELSESRFPLVHLYFGYHTLFHIVPLYLEQLSDWLKEITQKHADFLNHAIALSLAHAYIYSDENRKNVLNILDKWYTECLQVQSTRHIDTTKITKYDTLLKTVVLAYGLIEYKEEDKNNILIQVVDKFEEILKETKYLFIFNKKNHPFIREAVILAINNITLRYFNEIENQLQNLVLYLTNRERNYFVGILTEIYLEQRASLKDGDDEIKVKGRLYQIWLDSEPPLTYIEKALFRWVRREQNQANQNQKVIKPRKAKTAAQEIALRAFTSFAMALDREEERRIREINEKFNHAKSN
ncbi:MAG: hypothetical protein F6K24_15435, partial [Okeania sp. SIO2D1]|nr:hypothetical protein [Okeania sp. SIO2D1]